MVIGMAIGKLSRVHDYFSRDRSTPRLDEFYGGTQSLTAAVGEERDDGTTVVVFRKPITGKRRRPRSFRCFTRRRQRAPSKIASFLETGLVGGRLPDNGLSSSSASIRFVSRFVLRGTAGS